jgi:hypothetical protein
LPASFAVVLMLSCKALTVSAVVMPPVTTHAPLGSMPEASALVRAVRRFQSPT